MKDIDTTSDRPKIEIYFFKERIFSKDGTELQADWFNMKEIEKDSSKLKMLKEIFKYERFDTITKNPIYAGSYNATESDLMDLPFIFDDEIISFDFKTSKIELSPSAVKKLWEFFPDGLYSTQFAITANGKPILTGYFYNVHASAYVKHFFIVNRSENYWDWERYNPNKKVRTEFIENEFFKIEYNPNSEFFGQIENYEFEHNTEFYNAFKLSGRIAE